MIGLARRVEPVRVPPASAAIVDLAGRLRRNYAPLWYIVVLLVILAFAIRGGQFGNPLIHVDESFYLLVGDRMLHGELPFVDIWDRKPVGLFLIYAAIRLLGGTGIVEYQVVATLFVAATAIIIMLIGRRIATTGAATVAAILYMLLLGLVGGTGGQAPVFYNLFVVGAAWAVLRAWTDHAGDPRAIRRIGAVAMALIGVALQIKYTVVFEGIFFGLTLLLLAFHARMKPAAYARTTALWVGLAAAPSLLALGWYASIGQLDAFLYANIFSIVDRSTASSAEILHRLGRAWMALHIPIFGTILATLMGEWRERRNGARAFAFVAAWLAATIAGYAAFGTYFDHYALPLMLPLSITCAPLFASRRYHLGAVAAAIMLLAGTIAYATAVYRNQAKGGEEAMTRMLAAIESRKKHGLFVYDGNTIIYHLTGIMPPTRYVFPSHLNLLTEAGAIGVNPLVELRRILATRPTLVVDAVDASEKFENPAANALVRAELARAYRPIAQVTRAKRTTIIYERRSIK